MAEASLPGEFPFGDPSVVEQRHKDYAIA